MTNIAETSRGRLGLSATASAVLVAFLGIAFSLLNAALHVKPSVTSSSSASSARALPFSFHPELYHGEGRTHHFFEGWYHKLVRTRINCRSDKESSIDPDGDTHTHNHNHNHNNDHSLSMAVVPGVFYDSGNNATGKNESHAFIFVTINGEKQHYYRFDIDTEFQYRRHQQYISSNGEEEDYYVQIGNNKFSKHGMSLDLVPRRRQNPTNDANNDDDYDDDDASINLKGSIEYEDIMPWPIPSFWNLGAMGPVGYFLSPFLECYHDVLSFDHGLKGTLAISKPKQYQNQNQNHDDGNEKEGRTAHTIDTNTFHLEEFFNSECNDESDDTFVSSRGYVEKDRGQSFPSLWIWMQTNAFRNNAGTSLFFSVARIPILTNLRKFLPRSWTELEFPGFTAAVLLDGVEGGAAATNDDPTGDGNQIENDDASSSSPSSNMNNNITKMLIPFATWTGAYFEDLIVEDDRVVATLNSGGIGGGFWDRSPRSSSSKDDVAGLAIIIRVVRFVKAWIGSWFLEYDSRKLRYKLELVADRRVPHVLLYAPKTTITSAASNGNNGQNNNNNIYYKSSITSAATTTSKMEPFVNEALNAKITVRLFEYYRSDDGTEYERLLLDDVGEHAGLEVHQNVQYLVDNLCGKAKANEYGDARIVQHSSVARGTTVNSALEEKYLKNQEKDGMLGGGNEKNESYERYSHTKLANSVFTQSLHDRLAASQNKDCHNVLSLCGHPGLSSTSIASKIEVDFFGKLKILLFLYFYSQSAEDDAMGLLKGMMDIRDKVESGTLYGPTGFKGDAIALPSSPHETNPKSKDMLWKKSEGAIGSSFAV